MRKHTVESGSGRAVQLVYIDENGKLKTDPEAIGSLQKLKGPVAVVSLFGNALHGKSFIWNQVFCFFFVFFFFLGLLILIEGLGF